MMNNYHIKYYWRMWANALRYNTYTGAVRIGSMVGDVDYIYDPSYEDLDKKWSKMSTGERDMYQGRQIQSCLKYAREHNLPLLYEDTEWPRIGW